MKILSMKASSLRRQAGENWMITDKSKKACADLMILIQSRGGEAVSSGHRVDFSIPIEHEGQLSNVPLQVEIFEGSYGGSLVILAYFISNGQHPVPTGDKEVTTAEEILAAVTDGFKSLLSGR